MSPVNDPGRIRNTNKTFSILETLPTELLEKIFFYSLSVNLPLASPYVAAALSSERVYRLLILLAYWDNDLIDFPHDMDYNSSSGKDVFGGDPAQYEDLGTYTWRENRMFNIPWILRPLGRDYVPLSSDERGELQSSILRCKWCTEDRIRKQLPDLTRLIIARWCINAGYVLENEDKNRRMEELLQSEEKKAYGCFVIKTDKKRSKEEEKDNVRADDSEYAHCKVTVKPDECVKLEFGCEGFKRDSEVASSKVLQFPILSVRAIPSFLLCASIDSEHRELVRGSFTKSHLSLLKTIRISGQMVLHAMDEDYPPKITYSRDALHQGLDIALSKLNIFAVDTLLKIDVFLSSRDHDSYYTIPSGFFRKAAELYIAVNDIYVNEILPTDEAKGVIMEGLNVRQYMLVMFCLLLTSSAESVPPEDPVVAQLAELVGGPFGRWLLDYMADLPRHLENLKESHDTVFFARTRTPNVYLSSMAFRYHNEVLCADETFGYPKAFLLREISLLDFEDHKIYV